jgi:hypothetical protein
MGRPCRVCSHRQRQAIEGMILAGESGYTIGRQFTIDGSASVGIGGGRSPSRLQDRLAILAKHADARDRRAPCRR